MIIPHGLYDVKHNDGHVNLGTSHDTGEFACDSIERWWEGQGVLSTPERPRSCCCVTAAAAQFEPVPVQGGLATAGGTSRDRDPCGPLSAVLLEVQPDRAPLVPHVTRACQGVIFESVELVKELMERAGTRTGLRVTVDILDKVYQTGRKYAKGSRRT